MNNKEFNRIDLDIVNKFDSLFAEISEPTSQKEVNEYLQFLGYDIEKLNNDGISFINDIVKSNWRFADISEINRIGTSITKIPLRSEWDQSQLIEAIKKISALLGTMGTEDYFLAFRNLNNFNVDDLATILQEFEYKAHIEGIDTDIE